MISDRAFSVIRASRRLVFALLATTMAPGVTWASEVDETAPTYAVQNRRFNLKHEINLEVGVLPINAFTKGLTLGGGYTYHFNDLWAWEIAQFHYAFGLDTSLKQQLVENFQVQPTQITSLNYFGSSSLVLKPLYGKLALSNRWVLHMEVYLDLGPAIGVYTNPQLLTFGLNAGGGFRFHLSEHVSLRLDFRDYTFFKGGTQTANEMYIGLGLAFSFGGGAR